MAHGYLEVSADLTAHYETTGSGSVAVVFIPGWTMTTRAFEHQLAHLAGSEGFMALTYDPRGQGLSNKTTEGHHYEQHGRDLHEFLDRLDLGKIVLVGWSNGGFDALSYVHRFGSDRLAGLVMLDTTPKGKGTDFTREWVWFGTRDEGDQDGYFKLFSYDVLVRQAFNVAFAEWLLENPSPENMTFVFEQTNQTSAAVAAVLNTSGWFLDYSEDLKSLNDRVPLLYIVREEWQYLAKGVGERAHARGRGGRRRQAHDVLGAPRGVQRHPGPFPGEGRVAGAGGIVLEGEGGRRWPPPPPLFQRHSLPTRSHH